MTNKALKKPVFNQTGRTVTFYFSFVVNKSLCLNFFHLLARKPNFEKLYLFEQILP